jgi:hypothetical protein
MRSHQFISIGFESRGFWRIYRLSQKKRKPSLSSMARLAVLVKTEEVNNCGMTKPDHDAELVLDFCEQDYELQTRSRRDDGCLRPGNQS